MFNVLNSTILQGFIYIIDLNISQFSKYIILRDVISDTQKNTKKIIILWQCIYKFTNLNLK